MVIGFEWVDIVVGFGIDEGLDVGVVVGRMMQLFGVGRSNMSHEKNKFIETDVYHVKYWRVGFKSSCEIDSLRTNSRRFLH